MLLHQSLPGGLRLRLPHRADVASARELCARHGVDCDVEALLRFDPRDHAVVCAVALGSEGQTVVGLGTIALRSGAEPDLLIADDDEVREHLRAVLLARVSGRARRPARRSRGSRALRAMTRRRSA
jgi:hypothetical protein